MNNLPQKQQAEVANASPVRPEMLPSGNDIFSSPPSIQIEIDSDVATAKAFPRDVRMSLENARRNATYNKEIASACTYSKNVGNGRIATGPSIRLAEIIAQEWGNLRIETRIVSIEADRVVAECTVRDLERNVFYTSQASRSLLRRDGSRVGDQQVEVITGAAQAFARRSAILQAIPKEFIEDIRRTANEVARGQAKSLNERVPKMVDYLIGSFQLDEARILAVVNKKSLKELSHEDCDALAGLSLSVTEGEQSVEDAFPYVEEGRGPAPDAGAPRVEDKRYDIPESVPAPSTDAQEEPGESDEEMEREAKLNEYTSVLEKFAEEADRDGQDVGLSTDWLLRNQKSGAPRGETLGQVMRRAKEGDDKALNALKRAVNRAQGNEPYPHEGWPSTLEDSGSDDQGDAE